MSCATRFERSPESREKGPKKRGVAPRAAMPEGDATGRAGAAPGYDSSAIRKGEGGQKKKREKIKKKKEQKR